MELGPNGRGLGWALLAALGVVYGVGGALLNERVSESTQSAWWLGGALIMGLAAVVLVVVPHFRSQTGRTRDQDDKHRV